MAAHIMDIELDCKIAEALLDSIFNQLFVLKQEKSGHYINFTVLDSQLDITFMSLIGHVELEWQRAMDTDRMSNEDLESIARALGHCRTFFESQKQQLFCAVGEEEEQL